MPALSGGGSAAGASWPTQAPPQPSLMSHPLDLEQHGETEGKDSYLFSNPTFESYLDPVSDEELQPVDGCTTPRSAIKQQASRITLYVFPLTVDWRTGNMPTASTHKDTMRLNQRESCALITYCCVPRRTT